MGIDTTTLGEILLNVYDRAAITQLQNLEVPLLRQIKDASDYTVGGNGIFFGVNASGDEGYGFITENGALPQAQNEQVLQAQVTPKVFAGASKITGLGRSISSGNAMAFANGLQYHLDEKLKRMTRYWETVMFRSGTGLLALINEGGGVPDTTTPVDVDGPGAQWLRRNMVVDIKAPGGALKVVGIQVTDSDVINNQIRLASNVAASIADNDEIYLTNTQPGGATVTREALGLDAAISATGNYLGIDRALIPEWQGNVVNAAGSDIDEDRLLQAQNRILVVGGVSPAEIRAMKLVMHPNQMRKYFELAVPQREFSGVNFEFGFDKLTWNGHEFLVTYNCQRDRIWMGNLSWWNNYVAPEGDMQIDQTFGPPIKWAQGFDAGVAYWRCYKDMAVKKPNAFCVINNLADVVSM